MKRLPKEEILSYFDDSFNSISTLESILKTTVNSCMNKEINSEYYNLEENDSQMLSEERNNYINLLEIALEKLISLKSVNLIIEKKLSCLEKNSYYGS